MPLNKKSGLIKYSTFVQASDAALCEQGPGEGNRAGVLHSASKIKNFFC
jgi:hypothetical protein